MKESVTSQFDWTSAAQVLAREQVEHMGLRNHRSVLEAWPRIHEFSRLYLQDGGFDTCGDLLGGRLKSLKSHNLVHV